MTYRAYDLAYEGDDSWSVALPPEIARLVDDMNREPEEPLLPVYYVSTRQRNAEWNYRNKARRPLR